MPDDGLPSSETYDVLQDRQGYMWFATDRGVSRYDGIRFQNFTTQNGLPDNVVFTLYEDPLGRIWFLSYVGKLAYYYKSRIYQYPYNHLWENDKSFVIKSFECDAYSRIMLSVQSAGIFTLTADGKLMEKTQRKNSPSIAFISGQAHQYHMCTVSGLKGDQVDTISLYINRSGLQTEKKIIHGNLGYYSATQPTKTDLVFFYDHALILYNTLRDSMEILETKPIIRLCSSADGSIWISYRAGGIIRYENLDALRQNKGTTFLEDYQVTDVQRDHEGGYWFSTLNKGIVYCPRLDISKFSFPDDHYTTAIAYFDSCLWVGAIDGTIRTINHSGELNQIAAPYFPETPASAIAKIQPYKDSLLVLSNHYLGVFHDKRLDTTAITKVTQTFCILGDSLILGCRYHLYIRSLGEKKMVDEIALQDVCSAVCVFQDEILIGSINGLFKIEQDSVTHKFPAWPIFESRVSSIENYQNNTLIVGTIGKGLLLYRDGHFVNLNESNSACPNIINQLLLVNDELWLGTNRGLFRLRERQSGTISITQFSRANGLPHEEIYFMAKAGDRFWAGNKNELFLFETDDVLNSTVAPPVFIQDIELAGKKMPAFKPVKDLRADNFPLTINYCGLSYRNRNNMHYNYRLLGSNYDAWSATSSDFVEFYALPAGNYTFEVVAFNENNVPSAAPARMHFTVIPRFYEALWFYLLISAASMGLIVLLFLLRIRSIRKKNKIGETILTLRQKALTGQINPHFLHNALNSIQAFIMTDDKRAASSYLSKFARLMRKSLNHSERELVPVHDELELIQTYIELEQLRFNNSFEVKLFMDEAIDSMKMHIPSMIIQPFVENAILHNIKAQQTERLRIDLYIWMKEDNLLIRIIDNGIGIDHKPAKTVDPGNRERPSGSTISHERIRTAAKRYKKDFYYEVFDLKTRFDDRHGTSVSFFLPYKMI